MSRFVEINGFVYGPWLRRFRVVITPAEEGGFVATVPRLPGAVSEGETVDEALDGICEAITGVLAAGGVSNAGDDSAFTHTVFVPTEGDHP